MSDTTQTPAVGVGPLEGFREKKEEVTAVVRELGEVASTLGASSLGKRIREDLVKKLEEDRFNLVVVGEFNHGKTTFVNALLGAAVLPAGVTPTTAAIHHLRYGDEPRAKLVREGGAEEAIDFATLPSFVVGGEGARDDVAYLDVAYPAALLQERIVLVDTPGVNDLSLQRADITYSYIPRSDAVLFLLDAGQILKESERAFLQDKIIGQARSKIIFVITKWDLLSESEQAEALAYTKANLVKLVPNPVIFPVSAQRALAGEAGTSGVPELLEHLTRFLAEQRGRILLDNALGEAIGAAATLEKGVDARRRALLMDDRELARRIAAVEGDLQGAGRTVEQRRAKVREEVSAVRAWAKRDLARFVDDATRMCMAQIDTASPEELKTYFQPYLEHLLRTWAEAETKELGAALEGIAERTIALVREDAQDTAKRMGDHLGGQLPGLKVEIDTFAFDAGAAVSFAAGIATLLAGNVFGLIMLGAAPIIAYFGREKRNTEFRRIAKERAPQVFADVAAKIGPKIDAMIDEFATKLDAWVVAASEELRQELLEVLQSAQAAKSAGVEKSASERAETEVQSAKLAKTKSKLEELRGGLWGEAVRKDAEEVGVRISQIPSGSGTGGGTPPPVNAQGGAA